MDIMKAIYLLLSGLCFAFITNYFTPTASAQPNISSKTSIKKVYRIQIGAFKNLKTIDFKSLEEVEGNLLTRPTNNGVVRVMKGDYDSKTKASMALAKLKALGYKDAFIKETSKAIEPAKELPVKNTFSSSSKKSSTAKSNYYIQVGAFKHPKGADFDKLKDLGTLYQTNGNGWVRVLVGAYSNINTAKKTLVTVQKRGYTTAFIKNSPPNLKKLDWKQASSSVSTSSSKAKEVPLSNKVSPPKKAPTSTASVSKKPSAKTSSPSVSKKPSATSPKAVSKKPLKSTRPAVPSSSSANTLVKKTVMPDKPTLTKSVAEKKPKPITTPIPAERKTIHNLYRLDDFFEYRNVGRVHIHPDLLHDEAACEDQLIDRDLLALLLEADGSISPNADYYALYKVSLDNQHMGYVIQEGENVDMNSDCTKMFVFDKDEQRFTQSYFLSCRSYRGNLYKQTESIITHINNDDFPDLLQRIYAAPDNMEPEEAITARIWTQKGYKKVKLDPAKSAQYRNRFGQISLPQ